MQNGTTSDIENQPRTPDKALDEADTQKSFPNGITSVEAPLTSKDANDLTPHSPTSPHRGRKRKLSETKSKSSKSKKLSPPWKAFSADGPTSFTAEDGRRKSGRRNAVPLDLQPPGKRRQTRGEYTKYQGDKFGGLDGTYEEDVAPRSKGLQEPRGHRRGGSLSAPSTSQRGMQHVPTRSKGTRLRSREVHENEEEIAQHTRQHSTRGKPLRRGGRPPNSRQRVRGSPEITRKAVPAQEHPTGYRSSDSPRLTLRLGPRALPILNPGNIPRKTKPDSLDDLVAHDDPFAGEEDHKLNDEEAAKEASLRLELVEAARPGGSLDTELLGLEDDGQEQLSPDYSVWDYTIKHVEDFQYRLNKELKMHRATAKRVAQAAAAAAHAKMPKTAEELELEARARTRDNLKAVLKQLKWHLEMATQKIMATKKEEFFAREAAAGREQMREWVDRSEGLLSARTGHHSNTAADDARNDNTNANSDSEEASAGSNDEDEVDEDDEEGEDSSSEDEDEDEGRGSDDDLTMDQLRAKYANVPSQVEDDESAAEPDGELEEDGDQEDASANGDFVVHEPTTADEDMPDLEDVDAVMLDDEENAGDTSGTSSEDEEEEAEVNEVSEDDSEASATESDEDEGANLLGFFSKKQVETFKHEGSPALEADEKLPNGILHEISSKDETDAELMAKDELADELQNGTEPQSEDSPQTFDKQENTQKTLDVAQSDGMRSSPHPPASHSGPDLNDILSYAHENDVSQVAISPLIRGQLRPYQHAGFEWLAGMYENATNGILADEMGLGKTFQTIALLAHLATHHHVWGPHLIVVPTSVILNWEIEFKKFLPGFKVLSYYGNQNERQEKRKGWNDRDKWNVCITSYQLALSDQVILKRRPWHYLVLDEAHNIKNYKSQRWQTLLSFRSQARLLLTGTPLQNNLAELWSLLFFLAPEQDAAGKTSFGDLTEFSKVFHRPVDQILEHGRGALDEEAMSIVSKLHKVLRPHLLRRLKADVERQMPKKYEHVTVCRLSKRQRQLYDGYMSLAGTRDSFASGNYMSIINCLMQLRKVCNHPDLFETRQIVTSLAMPKSAIADYEIQDLFVRRRFLADIERTSQLEASNLWHPNTSTFADGHGRYLSAGSELASLLDKATRGRTDDNPDSMEVSSQLESVYRSMSDNQLSAVSSIRYRTNRNWQMKPAYSTGMLERLRVERFPQFATMNPPPEDVTVDHIFKRLSALNDLVLDLDQRSEAMKPYVQRFACTTPNVVAPGLSQLALTDAGMELVQTSSNQNLQDPFHESRVRLSIAFPDKSLIQYDCGKLQQLDKLLRKLQSGGHRAVIFTQMTKVLDILEQFMNLHGHRYLRLDGSTKIEQRQIITERFNTDTRILAFISSSRSGGLGINLTGADTVIFYDLDWNPAMDKQCQDRCHRIGQTRDVHIYRFVSEGTIEANILRKSNQKRMLDDVVIQEGDFTTEYFNRIGADDGHDDTDAAIDKVFGGGGSRMLQQAEDQEDQAAAKEAQKEDLQADDADFGDKTMDKAATTPAPQPVSSTIKRQESINSESKHQLATPPATIAPGTPSLERSKSNPEEMDVDMRDQLFDHFAANPLAQDKPVYRDVDEEGIPCPAGSDDYLIRLMDWELRDVVWLPPKTAKDKKKKKKGSEFGIIRR